MKPASDDLACAIWCLGHDSQPPTGDAPCDVWKQLQEMGMIVRGPNGKPVLTAKGERTYTAIEAGDDVPELEIDWPEGD